MEKTKPRTILIVDDEKNIISALKRLLRNENYSILSATSGAEGLDILKTEKVSLVISDQRMPGMNGTEFLSKVMNLNPDIIRIILSGYTEIDSITEAINRGHIYKFILKPWNDSALVLEIRQALEQYDLVETNKKLHQTVIEQNRELMTVNERLESMVSERTRALEIKNHALELSQAVLDDLVVPVIGIDPEGMIALINRAAEKLEQGGNQILVGHNISEYIDKNAIHTVHEAIITGAKKKTGYSYGQDAGHMIVTPMTGRFKDNGAIITFHGRI